MILVRPNKKSHADLRKYQFQALCGFSISVVYTEKVFWSAVGELKEKKTKVVRKQKGAQASSR